MYEKLRTKNVLIVDHELIFRPKIIFGCIEERINAALETTET